MSIFKVLTEFRFDIGSAVASSQMLQSEVGKISGAADQAHFALKRIGVGLVAQMGLGQGGVIGALYNAVKASDKFQQSQREIANIFLSNNMFDGADGYAKAMRSAEASMHNMKKAAREFSLPVGQMAQFSKLVGASLISHGLDDSTLKNSIQLSRGFLKSAPTLGIDPNLAQGQLLDAVMGRANMGDTLFQRLMNETQDMKPFAGTAGAKAFNALDPAKRLDVLTKSLMQFGSNAKIVDENARSLTAQLQRLSDNFTSMFSILKPLGDALLTPIKDILMTLNLYLEKDGEAIVKNFSRILKRIVQSPEALYVNIQQGRKLQGDVQTAGQILFISALIHGVTLAMRYLGFTLKGGLIMSGLRAIGGAILSLFTFLGGIGAFGFAMKALGFILKGVLLPLAIWTFFMQILSRAIAKAQIANMKWLANNLDKITMLFAKVATAFELIMLPITLAMDGLAEMISWFFKLEYSGNAFVWVLEQIANVMTSVGDIILTILSMVAGVTNALIGQVFNMMNGNFKALFSGKEWASLASEGYNDFWNRFKAKDMTVDDSQVSTKITNIDKIEINNQFKEQMEPDRIAFMLKDQLIKAATNPRESSGRSLQSAFAAR